MVLAITTTLAGAAIYNATKYNDSTLGDNDGTATTATTTPSATPTFKAQSSTPKTPTITTPQTAETKSAGVKIDWSKVQNETLRQALQSGKINLDSSKNIVSQIIDVAIHNGIKLTNEQKAQLNKIYTDYNIGEYADVMAKYGSMPKWKINQEKSNNPYLRSFKTWRPQVSTNKGSAPYQDVHSAEWKDFQQFKGQLQEVGIGNASSPYAQPPGTKTVSIQTHGNYLKLFGDIGKIIGFIKEQGKTGMNDAPDTSDTDGGWNPDTPNPAPGLTPGVTPDNAPKTPAPGPADRNKFGLYTPHSNAPDTIEVDNGWTLPSPKKPTLAKITSTMPDTSEVDAGWELPAPKKKPTPAKIISTAPDTSAIDDGWDLNVPLKKAA